MKNILIIGAGAMGAAFSVPCMDNRHKVTLSEPYDLKLIKKITNLFLVLVIIQNQMLKYVY